MHISNLFKKKKLVITHDSGYHADDVFACAALSILENGNIRIIRTRDPKIIEKGDYVVDVGGIYSPSANRFDHHQKGGAGARENTIPYAAFGLVWKSYGEKVCGSKEVAGRVDQFMIAPIDASDNGIDISKAVFQDIAHFRVNEVFSAFLPTALEDMDKDKIFLDMVSLAEKILRREIKKASDQIKVEEIIRTAYKNTSDKRLIVIENPPVSRQEIGIALGDYTEPLFAVYKSSDNWNVVAMRINKTSFENKKDLPKAWAGLRDAELSKITGVADAVFCHNKLFLASAKSKEGAIKLAEIALNS